MVLALVLFIIMYALLLIFSEKRWIIALSAALLFVILGILPLGNVLKAVNWNVLMMLTGTMVTVELFIQSKMPLRMAEGLLRITPNVRWAIVALSLFSGVISAFVDNVATVLMVAPVGLAVAKKIKTNPVPVIISIAVSSNLQGAATLVGDATSIMLGGYLNMSFNDFIWFHGRPGIIFSVELGALLTLFVLFWIFRRERALVNANAETRVTNYMPTILMAGTIVLLIAASQLKTKPEYTNGYICCAIAIIGVVYELVFRKNSSGALDTVKAIDYKTLLLLTGLFIVIEGLSHAGVIAEIAKLFVSVGGHSKLFMYVLIVGASVIISAFVDNIPYVATMLPVVTDIAAQMGVEAYLFAFGLLIGATLGGNITPIGASANIAGIGILQKEGYEVKTWDFMRIGLPFTLIAAISGALLNWIIWA